MKARKTSCDGMIPEFPVQCDFCKATHNGGIEEAIDAGWNFMVFDGTGGRIQMAGCPDHKVEVLQKALDFVKAKSKG